MKSTASFFPSDLYSIHRVIQNTQIIHAKELIVSELREYFAADSKYHYVRDEYGMPKVADHTDLPPESGLEDEEMTRIWIGQENKQTIRFLPSVMVKHGGSTYKPISFNQDRDSVQYDARIFVDGYGRQQIIRVPVCFLFVGAWDSNFDIDVEAEAPQDRSTIVEAISIFMQNIALYPMLNAGLFIKNTRVSGESSEDFGNDKIFKQTISLECRGEYRRIIPIDSLVDVITVCADFADLSQADPVIAENLNINFTLDLTDILLEYA